MNLMLNGIDAMKDMKAGGKRLEHFVTNQKSERHERPVVIRLPFRSLKRPHRTGEDFSNILKALDVRISFHLMVIIVDKAVQQRVTVNEQGNK